MTNKFNDGTMTDLLGRPVVSYSQLNDSSWITVHPNGQGTKGVPVRISENGTIEAGMGGKHNGKKLSELGKEPAKPSLYEAIKKQESSKQSSSKWLSKSTPKPRVNIKTPSLHHSTTYENFKTQTEQHVKNFEGSTKRINERKKIGQNFVNNIEKEIENIRSNISHKKKVEGVREFDLSNEYSSLSQLQHKRDQVKEYVKL